MQDVRQSIIEIPETFQYSCFHLEHNGKRVNDFVELSSVENISSKSTLLLVEDPYTEKEARVHLIRVRELIGAAGDRPETIQGISAGQSLFDTVLEKGADIAQPKDSKGASTDAERGEANALSDYDFKSLGTLQRLIPRAQEPARKTVKGISLSPWHPPPLHLRQKGHLLYLQVTTNEGEQYQITSHVSGFYVNRSSNNKFDPFPRAPPKNYRAHSLLTLISEISPSFSGAFTGVQEYNSRKEPLASIQLTNAIPNNPWLVASSSSSTPTHLSDPTRVQETYLMAGVENNDNLRDWNEEFQSIRELPKENVQDRVFRERLTSKLFADYCDAAARGAVAIARGEITSLNPTEEKDAQIYVYNNVFFSFGADGVGTFASEGGDEAARVATGKDVLGVKAVNQLDINDLFTPGTVVVDYLGKRLVGQSIVPGIFKQRGPGEHQIDYGAVDGRDVVASNQAFAPMFEKLSKALHIKAHSVWDKGGKQHNLEGSVETKGLLGTDGRKYVLDLYRLTPLDILWIEEHWWDNGDAKGTTPAKPRYPHRMTVLRQELVQDLFNTKAANYVNSELEKKKEKYEENTIVAKKNGTQQSSDGVDNVNGQAVTEKEAESQDGSADEQEKVDLSKFSFALNPDVFNGQSPETAEEKEAWAQDEEDVRSACNHLRSVVIPRLIRDLEEGDVGYPMDGASLTRLLHKRGINVRYLGKIANIAQEKLPRLGALKGLATQEMITRAFKHVAGKYMRPLPVPFIDACLSHLLNCLLGGEFNAAPIAEVDEMMRELYSEADFSFEGVSVASLRAEIEEQVYLRFRYDLNSQWFSDLKRVQILREICLKLGIQIESKEYHFAAPVANVEQNGSAMTNGVTTNGVTNGHAPSGGKKKRKNGGQSSETSSHASESSRVPTTFSPSDIMNIVPIIKDAAPRSSLAEEALEAGRISIAQGQKDLGQELLLEGLSLHEQIYGIVHPEVARVYTSLSMLYYQLDEKLGAAELARKAVIVSERTLGVDSAETLLGYLNLALFEHANSNTSLAISYIRHALELWKIVYGPGHPDSITTLNNTAVMLQHLKQYHASRLWFEESLRLSNEIYGASSVNTATLLFQYAQALALDHDSKAAVKTMREAYNIFLTQLGADDRNTKEADSWLEQLTQNAVSIAKQAKDLQARRIRRLHFSPRMGLGATRTQPGVGQSMAQVTEREVAQAGNRAFRSASLDSRSIDELLKFIEGSAETKRKSGQKIGRANPKRRGGSGATTAAAATATATAV